MKVFKPKTILVPVDFSPFSEGAIDKAIDIAKSYLAIIYVLYVVKLLPPSIGDCYLDERVVMPVQDEIEKNSMNNILR